MSSESSYSFSLIKFKTSSLFNLEYSFKSSLTWFVLSLINFPIISLVVFLTPIIPDTIRFPFIVFEKELFVKPYIGFLLSSIVYFKNWTSSNSRLSEPFSKHNLEVKGVTNLSTLSLLGLSIIIYLL